MKSDYLFVYGTLLKGFNSYMSKFLDKNSEFVGEGYFNGKLFKVSWYPGAVLSKIASERVYGHIFKIHDHIKTFKILDDYEGVGEASTEYPNEYRRELIETFLNDGTILRTWVYLYNNPTDHLRLIASGDYLKES